MAITSGSRGQDAGDSMAVHLVCAGTEGCVCQALAETSLPSFSVVPQNAWEVSKSPDCSGVCVDEMERG